MARPGEIKRLARLITEDPDILASPGHQAITSVADELGDDAASSTKIRKQLEQQRKQQEKERQQQLQKLDPYFDELEDTEQDVQAMALQMGKQGKQQSRMVDALSKQAPQIGKMSQAIRNNITF